MPLIKGSSRKVISANIKECLASGKPRKQCIAMSLRSAGKSKYQRKKRTKVRRKRRWYE